MVAVFREWAEVRGGVHRDLALGLLVEELLPGGVAFADGFGAGDSGLVNHRGHGGHRGALGGCDLAGSRANDTGFRGCLRSRDHLLPESRCFRCRGGLIGCLIRSLYSQYLSTQYSRLSTAKRFCGGLRTEPITERAEQFPLLDRKPQHSRRILHRTPSAPCDLLAHHRRVLASIAFVHVLQHALAITVREIDIDVGCFLPLFGEEALEQQLHANRIDGRDAEAIAHRGIRRGAAPLTEDPFASGVAYDVPDDEKESGHLELGDHAQLVRELRALFGAVLAAPALVCALIDES